MLRKDDLKKLKQGLAEVGSKDQSIKEKKGKIWILLPKQDCLVTVTKTNLLIQISMIDVFLFFSPRKVHDRSISFNVTLAKSIPSPLYNNTPPQSYTVVPITMATLFFSRPGNSIQ